MSVEDLKKAGNAALNSQNYAEAISKYTEAIRLDSTSHVLFSNRSAAYCSSGQYANAESDGRKCVSLKPDFVKGYSRIGAALLGQLRIDDAEAAYRDGLKYDADNEGLKEGLRDCEKQRASGTGRDTLGMNSIGALFGPQLTAKIAASPQHVHLLGDADFMAKLQAVQANPNSLSTHLQDPRFLSVLELALGAKVRVEGQGDGDTPSSSFWGKEGSSSSGGASSAAAKKKEEAAPLTEERKKATALKDEGNAAYKAKDFAKAVELYNAAIAADPEFLPPYTNVMSVYIEQEAFGEVDKAADAFIAKAREMRPTPFEAISKALTRKGTAAEKRGDLKDALALYKAAMLEHRTSEWVWSVVQG